MWYGWYTSCIPSQVIIQACFVSEVKSKCARITEAKESFYCISKIISSVYNNHKRLILLASWQITYLCARSSKRKARRNYYTAANHFVFTCARLHPLDQVLDSQSLLTAEMMSLRGQMRINHMSKSQTKTGNVSARIKKEKHAWIQ